MLGALVAPVVGVAISVFITRCITSPLQRALGLARFVAERDLTHRVENNATDEIGQMCRSLNEMVGNLAGNVHTIGHSSTASQQVTSEIARNASEAANASGDITRSIGEVSDATRSTTDGAQHTNTAAQELARLAAELQGVVEQFRIKEQNSASAPAHGAHAANGARSNGKHVNGKYLNGTNGNGKLPTPHLNGASRPSMRGRRPSLPQRRR